MSDVQDSNWQLIHDALDEFDDLFENRTAVNVDEIHPQQLVSIIIGMIAPACVASFKVRGLDPVLGKHG